MGGICSAGARLDRRWRSALRAGSPGVMRGTGSGAPAGCQRLRTPTAVEPGPVPCRGTTRWTRSSPSEASVAPEVVAAAAVPVEVPERGAGEVARGLDARRASPAARAGGGAPSPCARRIRDPPRRQRAPRGGERADRGPVRAAARRSRAPESGRRRDRPRNLPWTGCRAPSPRRAGPRPGRRWPARAPPPTRRRSSDRWRRARSRRRRAPCTGSRLAGRRRRTPSTAGSRRGRSRHPDRTHRRTALAEGGSTGASSPRRSRAGTGASRSGCPG